MPRRILAILFVLLGVGMIGLGATLKTLIPPKSFWSDEQAREYTEASLALKSAATRPDRRMDQAEDPQLASAQARFNKIKRDLDGAIQRRDYGGMLLAGGGVALLFAGAAIYAIGGSAKPETSRD